MLAVRREILNLVLNGKRLESINSYSRRRHLESRHPHFRTTLLSYPAWNKKRATKIATLKSAWTSERWKKCSWERKRVFAARLKQQRVTVVRLAVKTEEEEWRVAGSQRWSQLPDLASPCFIWRGRLVSDAHHLITSHIARPKTRRTVKVKRFGRNKVRGSLGSMRETRAATRSTKTERGGISRVPEQDSRLGRKTGLDRDAPDQCQVQLGWVRARKGTHARQTPSTRWNLAHAVRGWTRSPSHGPRSQNVTPILPDILLNQT